MQSVKKFTIIHTKKCHFFFLNSLLKHWLILIIFHIRHQEKTQCKWL